MMKKTTRGGLLAFAVILLYFIALLLMVKSAKAETKFQKAYKYVISHEGNYANHPNDAGRETYRGISRRFNPNWYGWRHVDKVKNKQWNQNIPEADFWAQDYYLTIWIRENFDAIQDTTLAIYLFDFRINSTKGVQEIKKSLNSYLALPVNNSFDAATIAAINRVESKAFLKHIAKRRMRFYRQIVHDHPSQKVFLSGWTKRAKPKQQ